MEDGFRRFRGFHSHAHEGREKSWKRNHRAVERLLLHVEERVSGKGWVGKRSLDVVHEQILVVLHEPPRDRVPSQFPIDSSTHVGREEKVQKGRGTCYVL